MLMVDNGTYDISAEAQCPNFADVVKMLPLNVTLESQKAYFILVSGQPPHDAKLVSNLSLLTLRQRYSLWN